MYLSFQPLLIIMRRVCILLLFLACFDVRAGYFYIHYGGSVEGGAYKVIVYLNGVYNGEYSMGMSPGQTRQEWADDNDGTYRTLSSNLPAGVWVVVQTMMPPITGLTFELGGGAPPVWSYDMPIHNPNPYDQTFDWVGPDGVHHSVRISAGGDYHLAYSGPDKGDISFTDTTPGRAGDSAFTVPGSDVGWSSETPTPQNLELEGKGLAPRSVLNLGTNGPLNFNGEGPGAWALDSTVREGFNQTFNMQQQGFAGILAAFGRQATALSGINSSLGTVASALSGINSSLATVNSSLTGIKVDTGLIKTDADSIKDSTAMTTNILGNLKTNFNQFREDFQAFTNQAEYSARQIQTNSTYGHLTNGAIGAMEARLGASETEARATTNGWGIGSIATAASLEDLTSDLAANSDIWVLDMAGHSVDLNPFHQAWFVALGNWTRLAVGILVHTWVLILVINGVIHTIEVSGLSPAQSSASNLPFAGTTIAVCVAVVMYGLFAGLCSHLIGLVIGVRGDGLNALTMGGALVSGWPVYIQVAVGLLAHFIPFAVCLSALVQRIGIQFYCIGAFFVYNRIQHKAVA